MKFLVVLAMVAIATCAPTEKPRDKRSFGLEVGSPGVVQTSEYVQQSDQSTSIQSVNKHSVSLKNSYYQPYQKSVYYSQPEVYPVRQIETVSYPVQSRPVYNVQSYVRPEYTYKQPIETYPVTSYDVSYPVRSYPEFYEPSITYSNAYPYYSEYSSDYYQPSISYSDNYYPRVY